MSVTGIPISTFSQDPFSAIKASRQNFIQLGQDLKSGNVSAARKDFAAVQENLSQSDRLVSGYHHQHSFPVDREKLMNPNYLLQELGHLGNELASGNLSAAQQAYAALQERSTIFGVGGKHHTTPPVKGQTISEIA